MPERQSREKSVQLLEKGEDIKKIVDALSIPLIRSHETMGMVVVVVTPDGEKIFSYGYSDRSKKTKLDQNSLFQVGSITKLFTTSAISIMSKKGLVDFNDKISNHFPAGFTPDHESINNISIEQLVTHSSGLDRENNSLTMGISAAKFLFTGSNLWGNFKKKDMYSYFKEAKVDPVKENTYAYSNVAYVLLGEVMSNVEAGKSYYDQVSENILGPLGLKDTVFTLNENQKTRLAAGHTGDFPPFMLRGTRLNPWYIDKSLWSAGSIYSTGKDLLKFLKVCMGIDEFRHYDILKEAQIPKFKTEEGYVGRSWFIDELPSSGESFVNVRGYYSGYNSFIGFDVQKKVGVIVLQNTLNYRDHVGEPLLDRLVTHLRKSDAARIVGLESHYQKNEDTEKIDLYAKKIIE